MDAIKMLKEIKIALLIAQNYQMIDEQEAYFEFITDRLYAGQNAKDALSEIDVICARIRGEV